MTEFLLFFFFYVLFCPPCFDILFFSSVRAYTFEAESRARTAAWQLPPPVVSLALYPTIIITLYTRLRIKAH